MLTPIVSDGWEIAFLLVHVSYHLTPGLWFTLCLEPTPIVQNIKLLHIPLTCCPSAVLLIFAWLFLPGVCFTVCVRVCMFIIFTKHNTGNKIMESLTQVYISVLETGQVPAEDSADNIEWQGCGHVPKNTQTTGHAANTARSQRGWEEGRSLLNTWVETRVAEI